MLRWMGLTFARFSGLVMVILGGWVFGANVSQLFTEGSSSTDTGVLIWILLTGAAGAVGGLLFLLSFDGPERLANRRTRIWGWIGMLAGAFLPSMVSPMLILVVLLASPALFTLEAKKEKTDSEPVTWK